MSNGHQENDGYFSKQGIIIRVDQITHEIGLIIRLSGRCGWTPPILVGLALVAQIGATAGQQKISAQLSNSIIMNPKSYPISWGL